MEKTAVKRCQLVKSLLEPACLPPSLQVVHLTQKNGALFSAEKKSMITGTPISAFQAFCWGGFQS